MFRISNYFPILFILLSACSSSLSNLQAVHSNPVDPGVYITNVNNSLSTGNSSKFIIYSETGVNVSVDTSSGGILPITNISAFWSPSANLSTYNATLILLSLSNSSLAFNYVNVSDIGNATIPLSSFGSDIPPSFYELIVEGTLGAGLSNSFAISSPSPLSVELSSSLVPVGSNITVSWSPFSVNGAASVYLLHLLDNSTIPISTNITDTGNDTIQLNVLPGAYLVVVNSSLGNGTSSVLEVTSQLTVSVAPSNISSANETTTVSWSPFDESQGNINLIVLHGSSVVSNTSVVNNGSYSLTLNVSSGLYNVTLVSNIGLGSANLTVYSSTGLSVTSPNVSSILYTNTTNAHFVWSPSDPSTENVTITLIELNTNQTFNLTVPNTGSANVNLSAFDLPPSSYQAIIDSALGSGSSSDFVIQSLFALAVIQPNASTNVSNIGQLNVIWNLTNAIGPNATIKLLNANKPSISYSFSAIDNGNATLNLRNQTVASRSFSFTPSILNKKTREEVLEHRVL